MKRDWLPLPPPEFMVSLMDVGNTPSVADAIASAFEDSCRNLVTGLKEHEMLNEGDRVLEVDCACGGFARMLVDERIGSYAGFDARPEMIEWCAHEITRRDPRFDFTYFDAGVGAVEGSVEGRPYGWPYESDSIDVAVLESVCQTVSFEQTTAYLKELQRVLAPGGRAVLNVFFSVGKSYENPSYHLYSPKEFWQMVDELGYDHTLANEPTTGPIPNWCSLSVRK